MARYTSLQEVRQKRWIMILANKLVYQDDLWRWEATARANMAWKLLGWLGMGIVYFKYRKKNGDVRTARGTLKSGISNRFDNYVATGRKKHRNNGNTDGTYVYWDLDSDDFRSFRAADLIEITKWEDYTESRE